MPATKYIKRRSTKTRRITVSCDYCGAEIERTPWELNYRKLHFCNRICQAKGVGERQRGDNNPAFNSAEILCGFCGKLLLVPQHAQNSYTNHFCNLRCRSQWRTIHFRGSNNPSYDGGLILENCVECFTLCRRTKSKLKRNHNRAFCSYRCYGVWRSREIVGEKHPRWSGGKIPYYGPNWRRQRRAARKRDNFTCRVCAVTELVLGKSLDVHHVIPFRRFNYVVGENSNYKPANALSNLVSLCFDCHPRVEVGKLSIESLQINKSASLLV